MLFKTVKEKEESLKLIVAVFVSFSKKLNLCFFVFFLNFMQNPWVDLIDQEMVTYESTLIALLWTEEITVSYHHHYKQNCDPDSDWNVGTGNEYNHFLRFPLKIFFQQLYYSNYMYLIW